MTHTPGKPDAANATAECRFLDAVARYFTDGRAGDCASRILVFPNKRSALYFRGYLRRNARGMMLMPRIMTIGAFYNLFAGERDLEADSLELLFILYRAYCNVVTRMKRTPSEFRRFAFWGWMMLSDFSDLDAALADAGSLYVNLKRLNQIRAYFLDEEQLRVIREIWGDRGADLFTPPTDEEAEATGESRFWQHIKYIEEDMEGDIDPEREDVQTRFLRLWHILGPVYREFNRMLDERGLCYPGKALRFVAGQVKSMSAVEMSFERVAFIGFNNLSLALASIMKELRNRRMADFFWDLLPDTPYTARAARVVKANAEAFPMPGDYEVPGYTLPQVTFRAIPSNFMQAKAAGAVLAGMDAEGQLHTRRSDNTVMMLADPALLTGVLHSLPRGVDEINVTMGMPYRSTPFASLMRDVFSLRMRMDLFHGEMCFFHEDVTAVISQPIMRSLAPEACARISDKLMETHQFRVPSSSLSALEGLNGLECIFADVDDTQSAEQASLYFTRVIDAFTRLLAAKSQGADTAQELAVLQTYNAAAERVFAYIDKYAIEHATPGLVFGLLERVLSLQRFPLSGSPVHGLQIMEPLETRCLDFENVLMLSMNERVFPRRRQQRSMIPAVLRRAYGLPVAESYEDEYAYYFFRLLSHSTRVECLYDCRTDGLGNGAMSRYMQQLLYLGEGIIPVAEKNLALLPDMPDWRCIRIEKTPEIMDILRQYTLPDGRNLSASNLKNYRKCPLKFYLENVRSLRESDEPEAFMDAATYGSIVHAILEDLFNKRKENGNPRIDRAALREMRGQEGNLEQLAREKIDREYYKGRYIARGRHLPGEGLILARMIALTVSSVLDVEERGLRDDSDYFTFVAAEERMASVIRPDHKTGECRGRQIGQWRVSENTPPINFDMSIDRHDILADGTHRFVDYKTGHDTESIARVDMLTDTNTGNDAVYQLCIYARAFADLQPDFSGTIRPELYRLPDISRAGNTKGSYPIFIDKTPVTYTTDPGSQQPWQAKFRTVFARVIDEIFDPNVDFYQTGNLKNCEHCDFLELCGRVPDETDD